MNASGASPNGLWAVAPGNTVNSEKCDREEKKSIKGMLSGRAAFTVRGA